MKPEIRNGAPLEARGRILSGTVITYGDEAIVPVNGSAMRETFAPGAFAPLPSVPLVAMHDESMPILRAGEYELADSDRALSISATLPKKSAVAHLIRMQALNGFSVRFIPLSERMENGVRVIERAKLLHVGVVDAPAYAESIAEVRARGSRGGRLFTARGRIPVGKKLACNCAPGKCKSALFRSGSFDNVTRDEASEILAVAGDYSAALASKKRKSIRFWNGPDGSLEFAVDIPNSTRGKELLETMNAVPTYARPVIDVAASAVEFDAAGELATYSLVRVRALTIGSTDADSGWPELRKGKDGEGPPAPPREERRRMRRWR